MTGRYRRTVILFLQWLALVLGVACVALGVVRSMWNFPAAIVSVTLVGVLAARERLYSDAVLQLFYVGANLYGWGNWVRSRDRSGAVVVVAMGAAERVRWAAGSLALALAWGTAMARFTDAAYPWWDAAVTVASMAAQVLMARRRWENWLVWIAVDVAAAPLYRAKYLDMIATLYLVYLALSVWGMIDWLRVRRAGVGLAAA